MLKLSEHASVSAAFSKLLTDLAERDRTYMVDNDVEDDFPSLLERSRCKDAGGFLARWKKEHWDHSNGYSSHKQYFLRPIDRKNCVGLQIVLKDIGESSRVFLATTREILQFSINHRELVDSLLAQGKILVALGADRFNLDAKATFNASAIVMKESGRLLAAIPIDRTIWNDQHIFLIRARRRS